MAIGGSVRLVNATGQSATISALPSGTYNTGVSGGSAIVFHRISDSGGGSDEIAFETHHQGTRHGEAARFNKSGNLKFPSGQGIDFSATGDSGGTMSSELFDDYEEGTCAPTQVNGSFSPTNTDGRYTKIGRMCFWYMSIQFDSTSSTNHLHIGNFPFTVGGGRGGGGFVRYSNSGIAYKLGFHPNAGEARAGVYYTDGGSITPSNAVSNTRYDIVFVFETA